MLSQPILEEISARLSLAAPVRFDEVTGSTNATCAELAVGGSPEWTLVGAGHQTAGRGRLDRSWVDRPGNALLFSVLLRPSIPPERAGLLPLLAGATMAEAASELGDREVGCKWPNDLTVEGAKVGGILAESEIAAGTVRHVVLGLGVNLGEPPPGVPGAGALEGVDPGELLEGFLGRFRRGYRSDEPGFAEVVLDPYRERSDTLGRRIRATAIDGRVVEGLAVGLDQRGGLVVETDDDRATIAFGDVQHLG